MKKALKVKNPHLFSDIPSPNVLVTYSLVKSGINIKQMCIHTSPYSPNTATSGGASPCCKNMTEEICQKGQSNRQSTAYGRLSESVLSLFWWEVEVVEWGGGGGA